MLNILNVSFIILCLAIGRGAVPDYKVTVSSVTKEDAVKEALKEELKEKLIEIEENLNYSSQTKVLDLKYEDNVLTVDLSKEIIVYGGGNAAESYVAYTLLDWGFTSTEAEYITLLIEGEADKFPEGGDYTLYMREDYETFIKPILEK